MLVKICGLNTREAVQVAAESGADFLGFVFFPKSPRNITPQKAAEISAGIQTPKVAVVVDADNDLLQRIYTHLKPDFFQLHGNESAARAVAIRETFQTPVIKAIGISEKTDIIKISAYNDVAEYVLLDAKPPKGADMPGGLGKSFDWQILATSPLRHSTNPFLLSGGLTPENVAEAIRIAKPMGVDVSSGVESSAGVKDLQKIRQFIANAKQPYTL